LGLQIFSGSAVSEFRQGLADVLIGGLLTSTLLTLLVVPTAYSLLDSLTVWLGQLGHRPQPAAPQIHPAPAPICAGGTARRRHMKSAPINTPHPNPLPPGEGAGGSLSRWERVRVRGSTL